MSDTFFPDTFFRPFRVACDILEAPSGHGNAHGDGHTGTQAGVYGYVNGYDDLGLKNKPSVLWGFTKD